MPFHITPHPTFHAAENGPVPDYDTPEAKALFRASAAESRAWLAANNIDRKTGLRRAGR